MASIKENNLELNYGWPYGESGWNSGMDENIVKLGFESRKRVSGILSSPPPSPSNGDAYIVGTTPTGLFSGKFANIAIYDRSSWIFIVPKNQEVVFNTSNGCDYIYNNGWSLKLQEEVTPYIKVKDFNFSTGYIITDERQCLLNTIDNKYYGWCGTLPKVIPAGSTPSTAGGVGVGAWVDRTDLMLRNALSAASGASLVMHKTNIANFVSLTLAQYQDLAPIYPEQLGAVAYGVNVAAADMAVDSSTALLNAFNAAVALNRKVVLTGRYKVASGIVCHYIQINNTSLVIEGQTQWSALVYTGTARTMLEIHGYRPVLHNFRCENTPDITGWDTKTAIKITGREGIISGVSFRNGWKEEVWGVDFSESSIVNSNGENDPFSRTGKTDNVGIGLRLNSCVNLNVIDSFFGYNNYVYRMGYLEPGETTDNIKPTSYAETITWGCEGIEFIGLRSLDSMYGISPNGVEVSHIGCIIDLNKYKIANIAGAGINFAECWLATNSNTPAGSTVWSQDPTASRITVDGNTFDAKDGVLPIVNFSCAIQNITNNKFIKTQSIVNNTLFQYIAGNMPIDVSDIILPTVPTSQTAYFYGSNLTTTKHIGQIHLGSDIYPATNGRLAIRVSNESHRGIVMYGGDGEESLWTNVGNTSSSGTPSSINAKLYVRRDSTSGRSINASGTINASGADYAEYMRKSNGCGEIAKGQIVGINSDGELTDKFSESIFFCIKSTEPNLVGGDSWSSEFVIPELVAKDISKPTELELEQYKNKLSAFTAALEEERVKWDRIAFCGQVPVLVESAVPGDFIVASLVGNDSIGFELTKKPDISQLTSCVVGKVVKCEDGITMAIVIM